MFNKYRGLPQEKNIRKTQKELLTRRPVVRDSSSSDPIPSPLEEVAESNPSSFDDVSENRTRSAEENDLLLQQQEDEWFLQFKGETLKKEPNPAEMDIASDSQATGIENNLLEELQDDKEEERIVEYTEASQATDIPLKDDTGINDRKTSLFKELPREEEKKAEEIEGSGSSIEINVLDNNDSATEDDLMESETSLNDVPEVNPVDNEDGSEQDDETWIQDLLTDIGRITLEEDLENVSSNLQKEDLLEQEKELEVNFQEETGEEPAPGPQDQYSELESKEVTNISQISVRKIESEENTANANEKQSEDQSDGQNDLSQGNQRKEDAEPIKDNVKKSESVYSTMEYSVSEEAEWYYSTPLLRTAAMLVLSMTEGSEDDAVTTDGESENLSCSSLAGSETMEIDSEVVCEQNPDKTATGYEHAEIDRFPGSLPDLDESIVMEPETETIDVSLESLDDKLSELIEKEPEKDIFMENDHESTAQVYKQEEPASRQFEEETKTNLSKQSNPNLNRSRKKKRKKKR